MASASYHGVNNGLQIGNNHGSILAEFHLPPERPETPPSPLSTVPFKRDPNFVSRDRLLDQIHEKSSVPGSRIALVGLGGVGKSQLVIEYSYRIRSQSPAIWVFWVHASTAIRFEQSFRDIADQAKIPERRNPKANIFKLVQSWLRDRKRGRWILILDNFDDNELLRRAPATDQKGPISQPNATIPPLLEFLSQFSSGSIVVTSRNKDVALKIVDYKDLIEIAPMARSEALELLQRKLELPEGSKEALKLVEELELMPLPIVQAASYIKHRAPRCTVPLYLEKLRKSDYEASRLLHYEAGHLYRDWEAKNSILITWQISFEYIRQEKESAADLLCLMSFFDRQGISEDVLRIQYARKYQNLSLAGIVHDSSDDDPDSLSESDPNQDFEDDIATLRDYSFITVGEDSTVFTMHRLLQLAARIWLKANGQTEKWKKQFISNMLQEFQTGEYGNWERCQSLFPHVKSAISQRPKSQDSLRQWATLLYRGAWYAQRSGNISDAVEMASKSMEQRVILFGIEGEESMDSTAMLATSYLLDGRWVEAEQLFAQVIAKRKSKLGTDHPSTLESMANLAETYRHQGRLEEAEQLLVQVIGSSKSKLGEDHPDTLASMSNLASTYLGQGQREEAEQLYVQVIETSKSKLGEDHPNTLTGMNNLASTYWNLGRWEEAEQLFVQVIAKRKSKLGEDHPSTLESMANLAETCRHQGRLEEAEQLLVQVIGPSKSKLGKDYPDTLTRMNNLASTYLEQGQWEEAEQLFVQVIETSKSKLGENHPNTLTRMNNLASTYWKQRRWEEARELFAEVAETRKTKLGADHPDTLMSMANVAFTLEFPGRRSEAIDLLRT